MFCSEEKYDARQTKCSKETPVQGRKTLIKQFRVLFFVFFLTVKSNETAMPACDACSKAPFQQ